MREDIQYKAINNLLYIVCYLFVLKLTKMTIEDYEKRDSSILVYLDYMINKHKKLEEKYPLSHNQAKRKAYQDIRYKMTPKNER